MGRRRFTPPFSDTQLKAVAIVPKVAAFPSILGSLFIVQHVLRSPKRRKRVYHRILLWMSVHDFIYSVKAFLATWPIPEGTLFVFDARGNTATCTAAGFLGHGGSLTSIVYNGSLTLFFLLVVRFGWKEDKIRKHVEPWLHIVPITIGWSTAIAGLPLTLYNAFGWTCWINSYPFGCTDNVNCERGDNAGIYRWVFFHAELWALFAFTLVAMFMIYMTIAKQERMMERYVFHPSVLDPSSNTTSFGRPESSRMGAREGTKHRRRSTSFAVQATFYCIVFFFTWFFPMLQTVFGVSRDELYYPLILLSSILSSMQGFSNAVIYLRPRWIRLRQKYPTFSRWQALQYALGIDDDPSNTSSSFSRMQKDLRGSSKKNVSSPHSSKLNFDEMETCPNREPIEDLQPQDDTEGTVPNPDMSDEDVPDEADDAGNDYMDC